MAPSGGFIYEFAQYGTVGENIIKLLDAGPHSGSELEVYQDHRRLYPQGHQEFSILSFSSNRLKLRFAGLKIEEFVGQND